MPDRIASWNGAPANCFRQAELSADGTTAVTYHEDEKLRTFVLPPDLLIAGHTALETHSTSRSYKSYAFAIYPRYNLQDPSTTVILQSRRDVPIRLTNALDLEHVHASYPLINPTTEAYVCPHSLAFSPDGSRFVAGSKETISVFDTSRDGQAPDSFATRAGRKARQMYGASDTGLAGLVTTLDISSATGVLAAGSTQSQVALYDHGGSGEQVSSFALEADAGNGVTQVKWDSSGTYLVIAGRQSDIISVFDMRSGRRTCRLEGRRAATTQHMGFQLVETDTGCNVWAGGTDGSIRVWKGVTRREGVLQAAETMPLHGAATSAVMVHPGGSVFATASGQRSDDQDEADVTLAVWRR